MNIAKAEKYETHAQYLTEKVSDMESAICAIRDTLSKRDQTRSTSATDDCDLYGHVKALAESAGEFASDAAVILGNASTSGTIKDFPAHRYQRLDATGAFDISTYATAAASVHGSPQPEEKHLQILSWISPGTPNSFRGRPFSDSSTLVSDDTDSPNSGLGDLEIELHGKRLARGLAHLEDRRFDDAAEYFAKALKRLERRTPTPGGQTLINDIRLLHAQALIGQERNHEAVKMLYDLVDVTDASEDPVHFSAKHLLAELAFHRGDFKQAERLGLDALNGRRNLANTVSAVCYPSVKLLIDIYKELDNPDEAELMADFLPPSELPRSDRFIRCDKEVRGLFSAGKTEAAVDTAIQFLKDNYELRPFWPWSEKDIEVRWTEMALNMRLGHGFAGWAAGMCALHFLVMVAPVSATPEVQYLLEHGAAANATFSLPRGPIISIDLDNCSCLMLAALHGQADIVDMVVKRATSHPNRDREGVQPGLTTAAINCASALAAAGGHFSLMQKLAALGLGPEHPVTYPNAALSYALILDRTAIAQWLIQHGATRGFPNTLGRMMMHVAAEGDSTRCIQMLVKRGEPVSSKDRDGLEPSHCAAMTGTPASVS
ncbi:ankyrin repeat-containing domain protein [Coniochaeta sp. 2T2.1]|nr:ankyrin repeat-containing domain protein [Coniochaeta sp. 2T2.1]